MKKRKKNNRGNRTAQFGKHENTWRKIINKYLEIFETDTTLQMNKVVIRADERKEQEK